MGRFAEVYLAKARRIGASDEAIRAIEDQFRIIAETIRRVEQDRREAEPRHVEALQRFAERAYRRPLSADERQGVADFYRTLREQDGLSHEDAVRDTVVSILMSPHFCYRVDLPGGGRTRPAAVGLRPGQPPELLPLGEHARRGAALPRRGRRPARARGAGGPGPADAPRRPRPRAWPTEFGGNWLDFRRFEEHNSVDRGRFPTFDDELRRSMFEEPIRFFLDLVAERPPGGRVPRRQAHVRQPAARPALRHARARRRRRRLGPGRRRDPLRPRRPAADGGLPDQELARPAHQPGQARLLGRPPPPRREHPRAAAERPRPPRRRGQARRADPPRDPGPPPRRQGLRRLPRAVRRRSAWRSRATAPSARRATLDLGGRPVDTRATFPRGGEGSGVEGLRAYLEPQRREEFVDNLCRKLLAYALGRTLIPSDDATIEAMRTRLDADGGRFGALVETIVTSPQFRNKRIEGDQSE